MSQRRRSRYTLIFFFITAVIVYNFWQPASEYALDWISLWRLRLQRYPRHVSQHTLHKQTGLLRVDVDESRGLHPIVDLIRMGEAAWHDKLLNQSRTLRQANQEYIRRYRASHVTKHFCLPLNPR
jgi:hypothetical protein